MPNSKLATEASARVFGSYMQAIRPLCEGFPVSETSACPESTSVKASDRWGMSA